MSGHDPIDELAALFLTEPDDPPAVQAPACELVLVGSLPVRASVWLAPYADAVARECGPVALLRLDGEAPTLQVIRAEWPSRPPPRSLSSAIAELSGEVAAWIVRPPGGAAAAELLDAGADRVVVLSSVNETAIVRAYQEVKSLWTVAAARRSPLPPLGLAVLGADRHSAELFHRRLSHAASTALGVELSLAACVQRIDATMRSSDVLTYPAGHAPDVASVLGWIRGTRMQHAPPGTASAAPFPAPDALQPSVSPDPRPAAPATLKLDPKPAVKLEPEAPSIGLDHDRDERGDSLARFVQGLSPFDVRCPGHEQLEIGSDSQGRLHVLARESDLRALPVVEAWARAHRALIARVCPGHHLDPQARSVLHVFTDRPASVADLHGSDLCLHVLAPVTVEGKVGWYHAALK